MIVQWEDATETRKSGCENYLKKKKKKNMQKKNTRTQRINS
jgi:hypothetical protein